MSNLTSGLEVLEEIQALQSRRWAIPRNTYWRLYKQLRTMFYRTPEWRKLRSSTLIRFNNRCVVTKRKTKLHVHHIKPLHDRPDLGLDPNNVIPVAARIHLRIHELIANG